MIEKQSFIIVFDLRLPSKLLKYLRRKRHRNRLRIIAAQVPTSAFAQRDLTSRFIHFLIFDYHNKLGQINNTLDSIDFHCSLMAVLLHFFGDS